MKSLDISSNLLQNLDGEMLVANGNLEKLRINHCSLLGMGKHFFDRLPNLNYVDSKGNPCYDGEVSGNSDHIKTYFNKCFENEGRAHDTGEKVEL